MPTPLTGSGPLAAILCLAAASAGLAAGTSGKPSGGPEMQEVRVLGVRPIADGEASLLYLATKDASAVLPLVVGRAEASAIQMRLREATPPRPLTHDLLGKAIEVLGARVLRVEIDALRNGTFFAKIRLSQGGKALALDARPSDSVALALRAGAPIFAARAVIADGGLRGDDLEALRRGAPAHPHSPEPFTGTQSL